MLIKIVEINFSFRNQTLSLKNPAASILAFRISNDDGDIKVTETVKQGNRFPQIFPELCRVRGMNDQKDNSPPPQAFQFEVRYHLESERITQNNGLRIRFVA